MQGVSSHRALRVLWTRCADLCNRRLRRSLRVFSQRPTRLRLRGELRKMLEGVMDVGGEPESDSCGAASSEQRHSILMVSDFFYPNVGGVEAHIYQLGLCLLRRGHKVVVLTHAYGTRCGVRFVTGGMKVYYVPRLPFLLQCTFPTFFGSFQLLRSILIRERITLVHAHQAFSTLGYEAMLHARTMGYRVVFTDHSLFGFADAGSIWINKVLKWVLADVHAVICVSHTSKENTVLRACLPPSRVSVVPNAVDTPKFAPQEALRPQDRVRVVVLSRLVYRKGVDLLKLVIPEVCARWGGDVEFVIGGDGSKRPELESMIAEHQLQRQVSMLGAVEHHRVREVLAGGHIFLNASLTEAFCMAIVEAASTGCLVVSTAVGGVPEVLPRDIVRLAEPEPAALLHAVNDAIQAVRQGERRDAWEQHRRVAQMYSWSKVTTRTERVYRRVQASTRDNSVLARLRRLVRVGAVAGPLACLFAVVDSLVWRVICLWAPEVDIDIAPDFDRRGFPSA